MTGFKEATYASLHSALLSRSEHPMCPLFLYDPLRHFECFESPMESINDLIEHIKGHVKPPHCKICWDEFEDPRDIDGHDCNPMDYSSYTPVIPGILPEQRKVLDELPKDISSWGAIWKISTEGYDTVLPRSPYLKDSFEDVHERLRREVEDRFRYAERTNQGIDYLLEILTF